MVVPPIEDIRTPPSWTLWPGKWGQITGPRFGGNAPKWEDPEAWSDGVSGCSES